jgi:hypothetical protein
MYTKDMDDKTYQELKERTISRNAEEVIYPISATARLNNDIAVDFRDKLQKRKISFLISEVEADDYLITNNQDYMKWSDDISERAWYLHPYIQTSALVNECVSLGMTMLNGFIRLKEPSGGRKDRYTSVSYGSYFISIYLDPQIRKDEDFLDERDLVNSVFW